MNPPALSTDRERSIRRFLNGRTLLITGATGFLGKALLEKILRSCPETRRIYLFIRPKSGRASPESSARSRLEREILATTLFDPLRGQLGEQFDTVVREKLCAVPGDLQLARLGLSEVWWNCLVAEVDVIVNCAATVLFEERLDKALELNALGPARLMELAHAAQVRAFLHVSTAYVSGRRTGRVPAAPVPCAPPGATPDGGFPVLPADVLGLVEQLQQASRRIIGGGKREADGPLPRDSSLPVAADRPPDASYRTAERLDRTVRRRLVDEGMACAQAYGWHDIYTFTKALGEQMILERRQGVPTVIVRPAIIESSLQEPVPGWIEGCRMADPLMIAYGRRLLGGFPADPNIAVDFVPVDTVVNALLGALPQATSEAPPCIFHVASSSQNPLPFHVLVAHLHDYFLRHPIRDKDGRPIPVRHWPFSPPGRFEQQLRRRRQLHAVQCLLGNLLGTDQQRARLAAAQSELDRLEHFSRIYGPYARLNVQFDAADTTELYDSLSEEEQALFPFDVTRIDWRHYIQEIHVPGLRTYVLKGADDETELADDEGKGLPALGRTPVQNGVRWVASHVNRLLLQRWFSLSVEGSEYLPESGPCLIAANHTSHLDYSALFAAIDAPPDRTYALGARDYFFNTRWRAVIYSTLNVLPFERYGNFMADMQLCCQALQSGKILVVFPEGTRSVTGELQAFKPGIAMLALASGVPIVPAWIEGAYEALPKGVRWPRRRPLTLHFGPAIDMAPYEQRRRSVSNHRLYREIIDELRARIETLQEESVGAAAQGAMCRSAAGRQPSAIGKGSFD